MPTAKSAEEKLRVDKIKALKAILACNNASVNPFFADIVEAIALERARLERALLDLRLLWSIYRRADKEPVYYELPIENGDAQALPDAA